MKRVLRIGETVLDILFKNDQPLKAVPGGSTFNSIVSLGRAGVDCAMLKGMDEQASRIEMAQRWSQDVCRQIGNNISNELVAFIKKKNK